MAKTKFFHVQIAHWGFIPILNRRGPIADVELTAEQITTLRDEYQLNLLNPYNGKPFEFPTEVVPGAMKTVVDEPAPAPETPPSTPSEDTPPQAELVPSEAEPTQAPEEEPSDETPYTTFDPSWFENFDQLSKNKQKKLRSRHIELVTECQAAGCNFGMIPDKLQKYLEELKERD